MKHFKKKNFRSFPLSPAVTFQELTESDLSSNLSSELILIHHLSDLVLVLQILEIYPFSLPLFCVCVYVCMREWHHTNSLSIPNFFFLRLKFRKYE